MQRVRHQHAVQVFRQGCVGEVSHLWDDRNSGMLLRNTAQGAHIAVPRSDRASSTQQFSQCLGEGPFATPRIHPSLGRADERCGGHQRFGLLNTHRMTSCGYSVLVDNGDRQRSSVVRYEAVASGVQVGQIQEQG